MKKTTFAAPGKLKLYGFGHSLLSGVQQGIQTGHAATRLVRQQVKHPLVDNWSTQSETVIVLKGGNSGTLHRLADLFAQQKILPFESFREDAETLENALTAVVIIIPESIYAICPKLRASDFKEMPEPEIISQHLAFKTNHPAITLKEFKVFLNIVSEIRGRPLVGDF